MPLDKVKLANKKWKREQRRKARRAVAPFDTPLSAHKRRLRNNRNHHRVMDGRNRRVRQVNSEED